eukprot:4962365-Karenia_brevis.AAC.1
MGSHRQCSDETGLPVIGVDYGFTKRKTLQELPKEGDASDNDDEDVGPSETSSNPVLCGRCSTDRWVFAHFSEVKGYTSLNAQMLALELIRSGYKRATLRSDGEPDIKGAIKRFLLGRPLDVLQETTSKADSAA